MLRSLYFLGSRLGNAIVEVERAKVALTSETGQRYTLSTNTRNFAMPGFSFLNRDSRCLGAASDKIPGLKAEAPEFHPQAPVKSSTSSAPASSLSTLVDTQNDTIIPIDKQKRHIGQAIGSATKQSPSIPSLQHLAANSIPSESNGYITTSASTGPSLNTFFSQDSSVFNSSSLFGPISIDHLSNASNYGLFGNSAMTQDSENSNVIKDSFSLRIQVEEDEGGVVPSFQVPEKDAAEEAFMDRFG